MNSTRIATAPVSEWLDPSKHRPPLCTKILLFTDAGIATIGHWVPSGCLAWAPLPKQPQWLKERMDQRWSLTPEQ